MNILEQLNQDYETPPWAISLKPFKRRQLADILGISAGYLCNVLTGSKRPGRELEQRIISLARQVDEMK